MRKLAVAMVLALAACGGSTDGTSGSTGGTTGSAQQVQPHLSSIQALVFSPSCALSSCHGGAGPQSGMNLSSGKAYASLVNVPSQADPGTLRVKPGDPENSLLYTVLLGPTPHVADQMPKDGDPLPQASIDAIKTWIQNGAPND